VKTCTVCGTEWSDETRFCPNDGSTLRSAGAGDLIGTVIADRYHIEKKLGEGGMGSVYLGVHVKMGRKSAIKVMARSLTSDPEAIARFNREAANAARINHPNVCAIYDFGETPDGLIYLAMELIDGESLRAVLQRRGALAPPRSVRLLRQCADALQAAHDLGIVHRDLKPDNIMLARGRGGADVVKVVDFGIAKAMTGEEGQQVTKTGLVVGTPEYMSPEQLSGDVLDGRSDIYSLALVFYRMLTGTLPFQAGTAQETMLKRLTDNPLPLNEAVPGASFPAALQRVMDRALARMPSDRYSSALSFASDATRFAAGMPPTAGATVAEATTQLLDTGATDQLPDTRISEASTRRPATTPRTPLPSASLAGRARNARRWPAVVGTVAIVAIGGGALAVKLLGSGAPSTHTAVATPPDSGSGGGRPSPPSGGEPQDSATQPVAPGAGQPAPGDRAGSRGAASESPPVEERDAAVWRRLGALEVAFVDNDSITVSARDELTQWYFDRQYPDSVRAKAAYLVAFWQSAFTNGEPAAVCPWHVRADSLAPGRYAQFSSYCRQP
jgi:serine/threonine protein kinase